MSLRTRLLCLVLLAMLLPASLLGWRFMRQTDAEINGGWRNLARASDTVAAALSERVQGTAQLLFGLAQSRLLDGAGRGPCSAYLAKVRDAYPRYTGIVTVLPDGQLHCDSLQSGRVLDLSDRQYVQHVQAGATQLLTEPVFGRLTGSAVLQIVFPARSDTGTLRFILVASLNLQEFVLAAQRQTPLESAELLLLDGKGNVMAWAGQSEGLYKAGTSIAGTPLFTLAQSGGTGDLVGPDGLPRVWAVADSPPARAAGLHVLLSQPRQVLAVAPHLHVRHGLIILGGAALLLLAGVWWLAEWGIRRPVERISSMVRDLSQGHLDARIDWPHARGELGELNLTLNALADSLQQQRTANEELTEHLRLAHGREISERATNEARLTRLANFDGLTGLPNRTLFRDRLEQAITRSRRSAQPLALMFLDLDRFKRINDSLGHDVGDQLLVSASRALAACLRDSASVARDGRPPSTDEVFRLGGDEFMILAENVSGAEAAAVIARRVLRVLAQPFVVGEHELFISASIGIALHRDGNVDLEGLVKQVDLAMYRSKELGRDTYCFFEEKMNQLAAERHQMEVRLRQALDRGEFELHYQPKADMLTGQVVGVEALLRWKPEGQALMAPDRFICIIEETGMIVPVGAWVFRQACGQMMTWHGAGMRPLNLAVNVSARQFRDQEFATMVAGVLRQTGFDPSQLEVELTESMLVDDSDEVAHMMSALGTMGIGIAIDDFGTGQSSLRYLKRFNVDTLKIDRSFVQHTPADTEDSAIAKAVIALGHGLGLTVVAEGVETVEQLEFLRTQGCDQIQGYLLSRPVDAGTYAAWMARHDASLLAVAA